MASDPPADSLSYFALVWCRLSADGLCDAYCSVEYRRVRAEWLAAGRPEPDPFIRARANWPAPQGGE